MSNYIFKPGLHIYDLPIEKGVWQFALFVIGRERWNEWEEDHDSAEFITWYVQLAFWQFTYTREIDYDR